jgi:hypothetical protein
VAPAPQVGLVGRPHQLAAAATDLSAAPQAHPHDHPAPLKRDAGDRVPGQTQHPVECRRDAHAHPPLGPLTSDSHQACRGGPRRVAAFCAVPDLDSLPLNPARGAGRRALSSGHKPQKRQETGLPRPPGSPRRSSTGSPTAPTSSRPAPSRGASATASPANEDGASEPGHQRARSSCRPQGRQLRHNHLHDNRHRVGPLQAITPGPARVVVPSCSNPDRGGRYARDRLTHQTVGSG